MSLVDGRNTYQEYILRDDIGIVWDLSRQDADRFGGLREKTRYNNQSESSMLDGGRLNKYNGL